MAPSTDVTPREVDLPHVAMMMRELHSLAVEVEESGIDFGLRVMDAILGAETEEDLWRAQDAGSVAGKDFVDRPFLLTDTNIEWRRSRQAYIDAGGFPFFFMAEVVDVEDGRLVTLNCGGKTAVGVIRKLQKLGSLSVENYPDGRPLMLRANPAESGYDFLTVHPAPVLQPAKNGATK